MIKKIASTLFLKNGNAVKSLTDMTQISDDPVGLARAYSNSGADELIVFDLSNSDSEHEMALSVIKQISRVVDVPMAGCGNIKKLEDVKRLLYAGCMRAGLNLSLESNARIAEDVSKRFGRERIFGCISGEAEFKTNDVIIRNFLSSLLLIDDTKLDEVLRYNYQSSLGSMGGGQIRIMPLVNHYELHNMAAILRQNTEISGIAGGAINDHPEDIMKLKGQCKGLGIEVATYESTMKWSDFKLNSDGMLPVVVQDYKTGEVLMVAYMTEKAYDKTVETGIMTYYSRSRNELWVKGATSGHYQYVKALYADCDNDTLLAKVLQIGAACHTGNRSCFFNELMKKEFDDSNPLQVFEREYNAIMDRKLHPKEGSYTNYLFDKGIDKILKKVGEECTEVILAAKNPDPEEVKYELADFLYHCMVLMAEKDVTWQDITREISQRR